MFSNRIEIILDSVLGRRVLHDDPIGYDQSEMDIKRSEKTYGIFLKQINNLEFTGSSKKYLEQLYALRGVQAKCRLIRKEKHPITDDWELKADGFLDFTTRDSKDNKLSIDFVEGGLREILVSQMSEKFELNRTTDINGKAISALRPDTLSLEGREIYLASKLSGEKTQSFYVKSGSWKSQGNTRDSHKPVPLELFKNSDPDNLVSPVDSMGSNGQYLDAPQFTSFVRLASRDFGKTKVKIKVNYRVSSISSDAVRLPVPQMKLILRKYTDESATGGSEFTFASDIVLEDIGNPIDKVGQFYSSTYENENFEVKKGESYALYFQLIGVYGTDLDDGYLDVFMDSYQGSITWSEDSFFRRTISKCLTAYEAGQRQTEIYTGKPCFESYLLSGKDNTLLSDSDHNIVFAPGGWLRNLKREEEDELGNITTTEWPLEMSFDDYYKSINALLPVGYGISTVGNQQKIILEDLRFFFQRVVLINLGKIQIKGRETAVEYCYQSLKFGYLKGGNYEKPLGLDEYNTQTSTRTPLTVTDNEYEALGPSRTDSYGPEDARRKPYEEYPDEDTPYDRDNFMFDVKRVQQGTYEVRTWQDDFETAPTGVYSPETAFNLNFTPGRNRKRHSYWFNNAIVKLQDEAIQFLNSTGNSSLLTKKVGESALKENQASIPIQELDPPIFEPEWINAEADFDQSILDQITGTTKIKGRAVNNFYGLAEFTNEKNRTERAYIFSVKVKDKFTFKLLKAYGV